MSAPLSPDAMTYLANVRRVLDRHPDFLPSAPAIPATQAVVDEIKAADPAEIAEIFGVDLWAARLFIDHIGDRTMGVPDPDRGHQALSADTMSYLREVREKLDEIDKGRHIPSLPVVPAPHEGVVDEVKAADPSVLAEILFLSVHSVRAFAEHVNTTPLPTPEEQEERLRRLHDAISFHERQINPWAWDEMSAVAWRLSRRAIVDYAKENYDMEVGGLSDPTLAEQIQVLHLDQVRGLCIDIVQRLAATEVSLHRDDRTGHEDEEAIFLAVSEYIG